MKAIIIQVANEQAESFFYGITDEGYEAYWIDTVEKDFYTNYIFTAPEENLDQLELDLEEIKKDYA